MNYINIDIPDDLLKQLDALPDKKNPVWFNWTPAMDAALLKYWPVKNHVKLSEALGTTASTALKRYRKLTEGKDE